MNLILERLKAKKMLEDTKEHDLRAENLLNTLYELIDSGKIHKNAKVIFHTAFYARFLCEHCHRLNEKRYNELIFKSEVDKKNTTYDKVIIFIKSTNPK